VLHDNTGAYTPDIAAEIDSEEEILADELGVSIKQAQKILLLIEEKRHIGVALAMAKTIGFILSGGNPVAKIYAMAFAAGLDQLNGLHSQAEAARKINVTRALLSHYVVCARDALGLADIYKFRKCNQSRETYRKVQLKINHPNRKL
jgi:hypothetical protein